MASKANYIIVDDNDSELIIRDIGPWSQFQSVTNAAEDVVKELLPVLNGRRLYYYDSEGDIGELRVVDGRFDGYSFGGPV